MIIPKIKQPLYLNDDYYLDATNKINYANILNGGLTDDTTLINKSANQVYIPIRVIKLTSSDVYKTIK